jgi:signal transduction histidine kinase
MDGSQRRLLPQLPLDDLLGELQSRLDAVRAARDNVHSLLDAVVSIGQELDLETVLRRITEAATTLVDAKYGALGIIGDDGQMAQFIPVGITDEEIERIPEWPRGRGILGLLIKEPESLRLTNIADHAESYGFPAGHPPMRSFLGVPIRVRDEVFGNLYLTEKSDGRNFDAQDEMIVAALATAAGVAIENARLYAETRQREIWLDASSELTRVLLSGSAPRESLQLMASRAREMVGGALSAVAVRSEGDASTMTVVAVDDPGSTRSLAGFTFPIEGSIVGSVLTSGTAKVVTTLDGWPQAPLLAQFADGAKLLVPIGAAASDARGVLIVGLEGDPPVAASDIRLLESFARQAAIVLELADARRESERYGLVDDRARIARDLHDVVIQRLFATAMTLTGAARLVDRPEAAKRIHGAVDDLDGTIRQIRSTIFALQMTEQSGEGRLRSRVMRVVDAVSQQLGFTPAVRMDGLLDSEVPDGLADEVVAVLQEALSNVVQHARATRVDIAIALRDGTLQVEVVDDGLGITADRPRSGLANLDERAARLGGSFDVRSGDDGGTQLTWNVPAKAD